MEDLYTVVATKTPPGQSAAISEVLGIYRSLEEANDEARRAVASGTLDNEEEGAEFDDFGCIRFYDVQYVLLSSCAISLVDRKFLPSILESQC
jgi:hypothetical protein